MSSRRRLSNSLHREGDVVHCSSCGHGLGPVSQPWKLAAALREIPTNSLQGPYAHSQDVLLREFACPECGVILDTEVALPGDPFLTDQTA